VRARVGSPHTLIAVIWNEAGAGTDALQRIAELIAKVAPRLQHHPERAGANHPHHRKRPHKNENSHPR